MRFLMSAVLSLALVAPAAAGPIRESAERAAARMTTAQGQRTEHVVHGTGLALGGILAGIGGAALLEVDWECDRINNRGDDPCKFDRGWYYAGVGSLVAGGGLFVWGLIGKRVPVSPSIDHSPTSGRRVGVRGNISW